MNAPAMGLIPCHTPPRNPQSNGLAEAFFGSFKRDYVYQVCLETLGRWGGRCRGGSTMTTRRRRTAPWACGRQPSSMRRG